MQPMAINNQRRKLLKSSLGAVALSPWLTACSSVSNLDKNAALISCSRTANGHFGAVVADNEGNPIHSVPLPARGHGVAITPNGELAVAFARRPGNYMQLFNIKTGVSYPITPSMPNRYFYGHGVFSSDGLTLYTTEGEKETSQGVIGVYQLQGTQLIKVKEFSGFGIGPHEVIRADDTTLAIGVGGVHTKGRVPLNLESMKPALVYLSTSSGEVLERVGLADHKLSIRHLSLMDDGRVLCGQQYRGEPEDGVPLVAIHQRGGALQQLNAEPEEWLRFNHYIASIAVLGDHVVATSPRGNCYGVWNLKNNQLIEIASLADASGVVVNSRDNLLPQWHISSGTGKVIIRSENGEVVSHQTNVMWDNHWSQIPRTVI
ncbi:DUF1513 domain-containing protein [Aliivibrio finisterrensis]|nr:DUF1513 domain-containing protein [Aliivibrio finisterrensis]RYU71040.1 DUF1513 domain-containing protein [Aliivibrio finisterrensis]RYU74602.1 DUF1513 domain-containing protein [Aliivibrio finisterrensis]